MSNNQQIDQIFKKKVFIVAEISANHGFSLQKALQLIKEAKINGADAVKFQVYTPDTMTIDINNKYFRIKHKKWGGQTLYQLYKKAHTPWSWLEKLKKYADSIDIVFFCTAFDTTSVDLLEKINVPLHKISSFELNDLELIKYAAITEKPLVLSTGMATLEEIQDAYNEAKLNGCKELILLKCVSSYPANPEEMNLQTMLDMKKRFDCSIGLSDHTLGTDVSIASVALGACMIERHFCLSRYDKTPDSFFSIEPYELRNLVHSIRIVEKAIGQVKYGVTREEKNNLMFRRSLFSIKDIKKGEKLDRCNIHSIRPGYGISPKYINQVIGKKAKLNIKKGLPIKWEMFE